MFVCVWVGSFVVVLCLATCCYGLLRFLFYCLCFIWCWLFICWCLCDCYCLLVIVLVGGIGIACFVVFVLFTRVTLLRCDVYYGFVGCLFVWVLFDLGWCFVVLVTCLIVFMCSVCFWCGLRLDGCCGLISFVDLLVYFCCLLAVCLPDCLLLSGCLTFTYGCFVALGFWNWLVVCRFMGICWLVGCLFREVLLLVLRFAVLCGLFCLLVTYLLCFGLFWCAWFGFWVACVQFLGCLLVIFVICWLLLSMCFRLFVYCICRLLVLFAGACGLFWWFVFNSVVMH